MLQLCCILMEDGRDIFWIIFREITFEILVVFSYFLELVYSINCRVRVSARQNRLKISFTCLVPGAAVRPRHQEELLQRHVLLRALASSFSFRAFVSRLVVS